MRTIALLGAGSAAIHQLRYAIGYGEGAPAALAAHPHGYFEAALPGIATSLVIAIAAAVVRIGSGSARRRSRSFFELWLAYAFVLAAIYGLQETLEGSGAIANGGWIGIALAIPAGLLVALSMRGAEAAEAISRWIEIVVVRCTGVHFVAITRERCASVVLHVRGARGPPLPSVV